MSNNMCSIDNGSTKHSMSAIVSSCSPSFACSPLVSKPYGPMFGSMASSLSLPTAGPTAFPFPPSPLFLSSLNLFNPQASMSWFSHNTLNTPLSLTTNESKDIANSFNDNNNNISKVENKYKDSTQAMLSQTKSNLSDKNESSSAVTATSESSQALRSTSDADRAARNHSENLNWLADVAIQSKGLSSVPSSPLTQHTSQSTHPPHASPRNLYHPSLATEMSAGQRMYSPRFSPSSSPTYIPYPTPNSPMASLNAMNGVRGSPSNAHFGGPFVSNFNAYQQFSPTTAQNAISPFLVPNQLSVANTRPQTFTTGMESYHQNSHHSHNPHNAILAANTSSIASQSGLSTSSRSPSLHSSDSSSLLSSGPFSSPPVSSDTTEPQTKSMMRSLKDSAECQDVSARNTVHESTGIKRKSPSSPELTSNEKNLYKLPFGREGSRKHRILKPPNISILDNKSDLMTGQSAPLSAPPIPVHNRQDFLKRIGDSDIMCYSNESLVDSSNCHPITPFAHQRRKSVPQTSAHKSLPSLAPKDVSIEESHYLVPNENSLPIDGHNRLQYPVYFKKGSIIQLGNGNVKRVEEMLTQDFIDSATDSPDLCADCSEVIKIDEKIKSCSVLLSFSVGRSKVPVTVEAPVEHPFFVFHKGWSSFSPERSQLRYGLKCRKLRVGDNCVSLTPRANSVPNLSHNTQKMHKNAIKTQMNEEIKRSNSKSKLSTNRKSKSPSDSPLSLVKSAAPNDAVGDTQSKVAAKEESSEPKAETCTTTSSSDNVPMSSSDCEPQDTVQTVSPNRRHSAPEALDAEPSKTSEPSNAS